MATKETKLGDSVAVISGPHEGRGGIITQLRQIQREWSDPEWYAVVAFEATDAEDRRYTDHISVPVRRLAPR